MMKITFNDFNHSFECKGHKIVLTDESFRLLKLLDESRDTTITLKQIKDHIWDDEFLPDYSAKRLIQALQSELKKADFDAFAVVYVESQGYGIKEKTSSRMFFVAAFVAMAVITFMFVNVISPMVRSTSMVNNRIIFITQDLPDDAAHSLYYEAAEQLRYHIRESAILLLLEAASRDRAKRDDSINYDNVGLVIEWYTAKDYSDQLIRMEIREARTKNLLASILLDKSDFNALDNVLAEQVSLIEGLITSDLLPLNKLQQADPYDPVWEQMRAKLKLPTN